MAILFRNTKLNGNFWLLAWLFSFASAFSQQDNAQAILQWHKQPLLFEINEGQVDADIQFLSRGNGYVLYLAENEIILNIHRQGSIKIRFLGTNSKPFLEGIEKLQSKSHYFIGRDPQKWHRDISHFAKVGYRDLYPGINAIFYGNPHQLEYDICVAPGKDPRIVRFSIEGSEKISIEKSGNLCIHLGNKHDIEMLRPSIYQIVGEKKEIVDGKYVFLAQGEVGFEIGRYDPSMPLIIDPILSYSTYLGGSDDDNGLGIAADQEGFVYVTGETASIDFPTTIGAYQMSAPGITNAFVTKLNPSGTALIYSTYLGGDSNDSGNAITIDENGNAFIVGTTQSSDFPTTPGAHQGGINGIFDAFITKVNATGSQLIYSTYLGGTFFNEGFSIAIDEAGNAFVTGDTASADFPTTLGAYQTTNFGFFNAFVTKLNALGTGLEYSTYLGGSFLDTGFGIKIDEEGNAYIAGQANSFDFPVTPDAYQQTLSGPSDAFITKLNPLGTDLVFSTFLGGSDEEDAVSLAIDSEGNVFVTGFTTSLDFPTTSGAYQRSLLGAQDSYVTKLASTGSSLVYSTYLGGTSDDLGDSIAVDIQGNAYVLGSTQSNDFPVTSDAFQSTIPGTTAATFTKINPTGSRLIYSTYLGGSGASVGRGIACNKDSINGDNVFIVGFTDSTNFPVTGGAYQTQSNGFQDAFVLKLNLPPPPVVPPSKFTGKARENKFLTFTEYVHILTWKPSRDPEVIGYRLFRNGKLIAFIETEPLLRKYCFEEVRPKGKRDVYTLVAVNKFNVESSPLTVVVQ